MGKGKKLLKFRERTQNYNYKSSKAPRRDLASYSDLIYENNLNILLIYYQYPISMHIPSKNGFRHPKLPRGMIGCVVHHSNDMEWVSRGIYVYPFRVSKTLHNSYAIIVQESFSNYQSVQVTRFQH
jgi:hypothetical protein